jgi:MerR family Zn(II)-responsive transcriptional regulator of zntA
MLMMTTGTPNLNRPLRIGELAAELGLNPKTIRYYEGIGLLPAPQRTEAGYRLYGPADRERLAFIRKARAIGLTLEEIGELLALRRDGEPPCGHLAELVDQKLAAVDAQLRALADFRHELVSLREEATATCCDDGHICAVIEHHAHHATPDAPVPLVRPVPARR